MATQTHPIRLPAFQFGVSLQGRVPLAVVLALRAATAAAAAYAAGKIFRPEPVWAPVSALIVLQGTAATTLGAIANRITGTLLGAAAAIAVGLALGPLGAPMIAQIAAAVALTALAIAPRPAARVATWTSVIVLMGSIAPGHPLVNATWRVGEVALGAAIGGVFGALFTPLPARRAFQGEAAAALEAMGGYIRAAMANLGADGIAASAHAIEARLGRCEATAAEAQRERAVVASLSDPIDAARDLRRLWHSILVFERAAASPVPDTVRSELDPAVRVAAERLAVQVEQLGRAIASRAAPPDPTRLASAITLVTGAVRHLRRTDVLRAMPDVEAEAVWLRRFALDRAAADAEEVRAHFVESAEAAPDEE